MKIIIMNDLHFSEDDNESFIRLDRFLASVRIDNEWEEKLIIIAPGDLTRSGSSAQFAKIAECLEKFRNDFSGRVDFLFAPGNHDNDFKNKFIEKKRIDFIESINQIEDLRIIDFKTNPDLLGNFRKFNNQFIDSNFGIYNEISDFLTKYIVYSDNRSVCINVLNTAQTALKTNSKGIIRVPIDGLDSTFDKNEFDLVITMFHYPEDWMYRDKNRCFDDYLRKTSDIVLIGHEHLTEAKIEQSIFEENSVFFFLSPSLYSDECSMYSEFDVDIDNEIIKVGRYSYDSTQNGFIYLDEAKVDLSKLFKKRQINKHSFYLSTTKKEKLNDYGVQLHHNKI